MNYFVTAIHTDSGKTITSAILCEALHADYWKPIQSGLPRDSETVRSLISNSKTYIHQEKYLFSTPASPHAAAKIEGAHIDLQSITLPPTNNNLIIEGAGGCLVPLNEKDFVIDIVKNIQAEIILVSNLYLGSINHTLLTFEAIQKRNLSIKGIVFNGTSNRESEEIILKHTNLPCLLRISNERLITPHTVKEYANKLKESLL